LLDEPTTGLHWLDVQKLMDLLFKLRESGHTLIVIEHNLDVIRLADHVIEIGPSGGEQGGELVFQGSPLELSSEDTATGRFLGKHLALLKGND
jgi:excinuclease ABC subunit A